MWCLVPATVSMPNWHLVGFRSLTHWHEFKYNRNSGWKSGLNMTFIFIKTFIWQKKTCANSKQQTKIQLLHYNCYWFTNIVSKNILMNRSGIHNYSVWDQHCLCFSRTWHPCVWEAVCFLYITLHGSPPAEALAAAPCPPPITPSRLSPWKAPNNDFWLCLDAGFLAGLLGFYRRAL